MTFAAVTLLGMTMGQPLGTDYYPLTSRKIQLPIKYLKPKKDIRHVLLYVARNGENTWSQEALVTPDQDSFTYIAKEDGLYWFTMVIEDMKGNKDPVDVTRTPPDIKMLIDETPPQIRVTNARRNGEEIVIEWAIEEKFLNDAATKIHFCATGDPRARWREVTREPRSSGVGFRCGMNDAITVRITAVDLAGNSSEVTKDYPAAGAGATTAAYPPTPSGTAGPTTPAVTPSGAGSVAVVPVVNTQASGGGAIAPPPPADLTQPNPNPVPPPAITPPTIQPPAFQPPTTPQPPSYQPAIIPSPEPNWTRQSMGGTNGSLQPLPTVDPKAPQGSAPASQGSGASGGWSGNSPSAEPVRAQTINYARFDLGYDVQQRGPSGISRVDLWVTRNDGKSWRRWSQHDGKGGAVRVTLDVQNAQELEGTYGFRLVPVSGAGLSEREPVEGDTPDMRIVLDVTPPQLELFQPAADPNNTDTLLILWKATDRNFGDDPITLEWSEATAGPWHPIASAGNDPVVQATAVVAPVPKKLANTGQFGWRVPAGTPARVYLKVTARDGAGNVTEKVTVNPVTVDLTKPRARISGIVPPGGSHP